MGLTKPYCNRPQAGFFQVQGDYCTKLQKNIHALIPRKAPLMVLAGLWNETKLRQEGEIRKTPETWEIMKRQLSQRT